MMGRHFCEVELDTNLYGAKLGIPIDCPIDIRHQSSNMKFNS